MFEPVSIGLSLLSVLARKGIDKLMEKALERKISKKDIKKQALVVLELGRPITDDVSIQLGEPDIVIKRAGEINIEAEAHKIASEVYKAIAIIQRFTKEIILVLSGPLAVAFFIGQLVGLSHFRIRVAQWQKGRYVVLEDMSEHRELLF